METLFLKATTLKLLRGKRHVASSTARVTSLSVKNATKKDEYVHYLVFTQR